jgi:hypothetical protein
MSPARTVGLLVKDELKKKKLEEKFCGLMTVLSDTYFEELKKNESQDKLQASWHWNQVLLNHNSRWLWAHQPVCLR